MALDMNVLFELLAHGGYTPTQKAFGAATSRAYGAKSYAGLIQQLLGGGGQFSMDKDNFTLKGPSAELATKTPDAQSGGFDPGGLTPMVPNLESIGTEPGSRSSNAALSGNTTGLDRRALGLAMLLGGGSSPF